jgi:PLD-like domain
MTLSGEQIGKVSAELSLQSALGLPFVGQLSKPKRKSASTERRAPIARWPPPRVIVTCWRMGAGPAMKKFLSFLQAKRIAALFAFLICASGDALAHPQCEVSFSPGTNLGKIDQGLIVGAKSRINMAAYRLSDIGVVETLRAAIARGVVLRIVIDQNLTCQSHVNALDAHIRVKPSGRPLMHLKAYSVDGEVYRSGSANFSTPGLRRQNNDLIVCSDTAIAQQFDQQFEALWSAYLQPQCRTPRSRPTAEPPTQSPAQPPSETPAQPPGQ